MNGCWSRLMSVDGVREQHTNKISTSPRYTRLIEANRDQQHQKSYFQKTLEVTKEENVGNPRIPCV